MNGPSKLHAAISSKQFFGLELLFSVKAMYIYLNLIDLSKKNTFLSI